MPNYKFRIFANNIAVHTKLNANYTINNTCVGIFAPNGTGKTALSRMIRLADKCCPIKNASRINKYITFQEEHGKFEFSFFTDDVSDKLLKIALHKDTEPIIENNTPFIFHVFNSDYVNDNLAANRYKFDDKIEGYIIGKENIDLSIHEINIPRKEDIIKELKSEIERNIGKALRLLDQIPIRGNTTEYREINYYNMYNGIQKKESESFENLRKKYQAIKSMPDNIEDIPLIPIIDINESKLVDICKFLMQSFSKGKITEDFKQKVREKEKFIEEGMKLLSENRCPFCEQVLEEDALSLIDKYNIYMKDEETKIRKVAQDYNTYIKELRKLISIFINNCLLSVAKYNNIKAYIPSMMNNILPQIDDISTIEPQIKELIDALNKKESDISQSIFMVDVITKIISFIEVLKEKASSINHQIDVLNKKKNNMDDEKLLLRRRLCNAIYIETYNGQIDKIKAIKTLENDINDIKKKIDEIQRSFNESKKKKVTEEIKKYMNLYFGNKYVFDEKKFCLRLQDNILDETEDYLSDGEKSILAFIYFLASTHRDIQKKSEYSNLFFVIDDPVSSMDFQYVYTTANIIRDLHEYFGCKVPILILTHNIEFMSILMRNNIIGKRFILSKNNLEPLGKDLIMPYEEHLRDIYNVSKRKIPPSHTTPNSIRHVLETLWKFEEPDTKKLGLYLKKQKMLTKNAFLDTLVHDSSHGIIRTQPAYTPDVIIDACETVIEFVSNKYSGQISHIDAEYTNNAS